MKQFMLVVIDRYDVSKSDVSIFSSDLEKLEDVLIKKVCEEWCIEVDEFGDEEITIKKDKCVGFDLEEDSYLLIEL